MKLRRQLLIISLVTLVLPWAGVQLLRQMAKALEHHHAQTLTAITQAAAHMVAAQTQAIDLIKKAEPLMPGAPPLIAPPLHAPIIVDGYPDDWHQYPWRKQPFINVNPTVTKPQVNLRAGLYQGNVTLLIQVADTTRNYFTPNQLNKSDHLQLVLPAVNGWLQIYTAAPGQVQVVKRTPAQAAPVYEVFGFWVETANGYQVELNLPVAHTAGGIQINVHNGQTGQLLAQSSHGVAPVITHQPHLKTLLAPLAKNSTRLYVLNPNGYILASLRGATGAQPKVKQWVVKRWMQTLVGGPHWPTWQNPMISGQVRVPKMVTLPEPLAPAVTTLTNNKMTLHRVVVPIVDTANIDTKNINTTNSVVGFVVAEQSTDVVHVLLTGTAGSLLLYSLGATLLATLISVLYASWLSFRIGRLNQWVSATLQEATPQAPSTNNKNANSLKPRLGLNAKDEIGELARNYATLTQRLNAYTDYLQSLANKLSHELRTPLAVVKSSLENLDQLSLPEAATNYSKRAQTGAQRLSKILTAMSAANRLEQSLESAEFEVVDLQIMLSQLAAAYDDVYTKQHVHFECQGTGAWVKNIAPDLLVQALDKLIENAASFTPDGGRITLRLIKTSHTIAIEVQNPGPPLPEGMAHSLFDSLVSVRPQKTEADHLGLGLYIVRLIAQFHGAEVSAKNVAGGVVFGVVWQVGRGAPQCVA